MHHKIHGDEICRWEGGACKTALAPRVVARLCVSVCSCLRKSSALVDMETFRFGCGGAPRLGCLVPSLVMERALRHCVHLFGHGTFMLYVLPAHVG